MTGRERRRYDAIGAWVIIVTISLVLAVIVSQVSMFVERITGWDGFSEHVARILLAAGAYLLGRRHGRREVLQ